MSDPLLFVDTSESNVTVTGNLHVTNHVGIGTTNPIASLDIDGGPESDIVPALSIRGGIYDTSDLYVLNTYSVSTGVGYAAKVIGVNIKNKVETDNTVQLRNNVGGLTSAGAIYLGSDNTTNQGVFGVLTCEGVAGTTLTEKFTVTDSGNVGIGTLSPQRLLHLKRSGAATFQRIQNVNNNNGCGIELMRGNTDTWGATAWSDWRINNTGHLDFGVKYTGTDIPSVLHLNADGDVAFGTSTVVDSRALLHIKNHVGGIAFQASTNSNSRNWRIRNDDLADHGSFQILVSDNNSSHPSSGSHAVMTMLRNRRVGIGTTDPGSIFEVKK